jgi:hypothetical protein
MVHGFEEKSLQVGDISGNMKCQDLTPAGLGDLRARGKAFYDQAGAFRMIALLDNRRVSRNLPDMDRKRPDAGRILIAQMSIASQFADQNFGGVHGESAMAKIKTIDLRRGFEA